MPLRHAERPELGYYLISVDKNAAERRDDPDAIGGLLSDRVVQRLKDDPITDVFLISHGWMGDVPAAVRQYDKWIAAMAAAEEDVNMYRQARPGFKPLLIGFHWPSLPFGDESFGGVAFSSPDSNASTSIDQLIDEWADRIADTPAARAALRTILESASEDVQPAMLPHDVVAAYCTLDRESGMASGGPAAGPGDDREPFDAEATYQAGLDESGVSFGSFSAAILGPLRSMSYFKMKDRARHVGEVGAHGLLATFQDVAAAAGRDVRFHLMGHSFGCVVQSATAAGAPGAYKLRKPVDSLTLVQGAISLWSYCSDIPHAQGSPGYFRSIIDKKRVNGAIVTTQSEYDTAVGKLYPIASGVNGAVAFDAAVRFPKYGAVGTFGARGPGCDSVDLDMCDSATPYKMERGRIYNINANNYISHMDGSSGAHNDIARTEVAHAMWAAVRLS